MTSQTMIREMTSVPLEVKATAGVDGEAGTFEGYGAIFGNLDRDGDVVARGAFSESLKGRMPALLWQHNAKEPIGRFDIVREDDKGLHVKGRLSMEGRGREAYDLLKMGALDGLSIGFVTKEASRDAVTGIRTITKADLMEISLVTFPANELARVSAVKSAGLDLETPRDFERFLRESGFSRSRAKAITAKGFERNQTVRANGSDIEDCILLLKRSQNRVCSDLGLALFGEGLSRKSRNTRLGDAVRGGKSDSGTAAELLKEILAHAGKELWEEASHALKAETARQLVLNSFVEAGIRHGSNRARAIIAPGEQETFDLPLMWHRSGRQVVAAKVTPKSGAQNERPPQFKCLVSFYKWGSRGLERDEVILSDRNVSAKIDVGGLQAVNSWAQGVRLDDILQASRLVEGLPYSTRIIVKMGKENAGPTEFEFLKG